MTELASQSVTTEHATIVDDTTPQTTSIGRPLNVCMMVDNLARAGVETQLLQLIERFDRNRINPYLCLLDGRGEISRSMEPKCCPVERLGVRALRRPSTVAKAIQFGKYLRRNKIDIVHPHFQDSMYFAAPIAKLVGVSCVVRFRVNLGYWMRPIDYRLMKFYNRFIDATLVNCRACRDAVIEQEHAPPKSVTVIPNGVDLKQYEEHSNEEISRWETNAVRTIGVVANLRHVKGLDIFIRAAALVSAQNDNVRFVIAGEGDLRSELESLIHELGLQDRFELPGRMDDIPRFLRDIDIAVLSSRSEGAPNVIMEYMAAGKPVVATDVGGVGEILYHGETGLLVSPESPGELADAINTLLSNTEMIVRFSHTARLRAFAECGLNKQARCYESFYGQCYHSKIPVSQKDSQ